MIVIVILGVLATVSVFAVRGLTADAKASSCATDKKTLEVALATYAASTPSNPTPSESDVVAAGLLRAPSEYYDIIAGDVVPAAGNPGGCS